MQLETVNEKFVEARDEIEYAQEDAETVYFNESHDAAKEAVTACLDLFSSISSQLDESERGTLHARLTKLLESACYCLHPAALSAVLGCSGSISSSQLDTSEQGIVHARLNGLL